MNNIQKSFKAKAQMGLRSTQPALTQPLHLSNGGQGLRQQGFVQGPGTGTSDSVPAMISKGEYVLPADTVAHVGKANLDALKDATHTPVNNGLRGGMQHMADGGFMGDAGNMIGEARDWMASKIANGDAPANAQETVAHGPVPAGNYTVSPRSFDTLAADPALAAPTGVRAADPAAGYTRYNPSITTTPPTPPAAPELTTTLGAAPQAAPAASTTTESAPGIVSRAANGVRSMGSWLGRAANVGGVLGGTYAAADAARDMHLNGVNTDNSTRLAGGTALGLGSAGSFVPALAGGLAAPLTATVGGAALMGNQIGKSITKSNPSLADGLASPGEAISRWWNGQPLLHQEAGTAHMPGGDTQTPGRPDSYYKDQNPSAAVLAAQANSRGADTVSAPTTPAPTTPATPSTPAPTVASAPVPVPDPIVGKDGMATDGSGNPIPGYGSMTNSSGKRVFFSPGSGTQQGSSPGSVAANLRAAYAPTQYADDRPGEAMRDFAAGRGLQSGNSGGLGQGDSLADLAYRGGMQKAAMRQQGLNIQQQQVTGDQGLRSREIDSRYGSEMYGHDVQRENNQSTVQASMINSAALRDQARAQMAIAQMNHRDLLGQQDITNKREQDAQNFEQNQKSDTQLTTDLQKQNPGSEPGKFDDATVAQQRTGIGQSMAALGIKSYAALDPLKRQQLLAGSKLISKINSNASTWNPFMADYMKTVMPHNLVGMKRMTNGDYQTPDYTDASGAKRSGQVIPGRIVDKVNSDRIMGQPSGDEFSSLMQGGQ